MTTAFDVNGQPWTQTNLKDETTDRQERLLEFSPSLLLTPHRRYVEKDADNNLLRWHDATGRGFYAPRGGAVEVRDGADDMCGLAFYARAGQALRDSLNLDRLPAPGQPGTIALLLRERGGAGTLGGGILGNRAPFGTDLLALYVDESSGNLNLQMRFGDLDRALFSTVSVTDTQSHIALMTWKGAEAGARVIQDAVPQLLVNNTLMLGDDPDARKLVIGGYGAPATNPLRGLVGAIGVWPVYTGDDAGADLRDDIYAEFTSYLPALGA
ncbi:hypothetical protein [Sphingobium yanoikuyae]|uniref:hypothetical protein n=1 Tax=Sphingobium yanoikuyae TaxID=13690 RepID=UPI0028A74469|nr:hypothetical protein [Sphingobium yanoikuyae]